MSLPPVAHSTRASYGVRMFKRAITLTAFVAAIAAGSVVYSLQKSDASEPEAQVIGFNCGWIETSAGALLHMEGVAVNISYQDFFDVRPEFDLYDQQGNTLLTINGAVESVWYKDGSPVSDIHFKRDVNIERSLAQSVYDCGVSFRVDGQRLDAISVDTAMWGDHPDY